MPDATGKGDPKAVAVLPLVDEGTEFLPDKSTAKTVQDDVEKFFVDCGCKGPDDAKGNEFKDFESNTKWQALDAPAKGLVRRTVAYLKSKDTHALKKHVTVKEYDLDQFDALEKNEIVSTFKDKILRTMRASPMAANEVFVTLEKGSIKGWTEIANPDGDEVWPTEDDLRDAIREVLRQRKHAKPQPEKPKEVPQVPMSSYAPYTPAPQTQVYNYAPVPQTQFPNYAPVPQMQLPNYAPVLQPQVPNYAPVPQTQGIVRQVPLGVGGIVNPGYNAGSHAGVAYGSTVNAGYNGGYNGGLLRSVSFEGGGVIGGGVIGGASYGGTRM